MDSGLAEVSQLLASVSVPPMPDILTQRVQAAIANEAAQRAARMAGPVSGLAQPGDRASRLARPRMGRWSPPLLLRGLAAAGALVILVGGGLLLANQRQTGGASGAASPATRQPENSGAAIGSAVAAQLRYRHGAGYLYANAVTSNVNYTSKSLAPGVRHAVENSTPLSNPSQQVPSIGASLPSGRLLGFRIDQLESCLSAVAASSPVSSSVGGPASGPVSGPVLLVEVARYQGQPATIIVTRPVGGLSHVIVVGLACGGSNQDILTRLTVPVP